MCPKHSISIYTGPGASNSWIWLADFLENHGYLRTRFCHEPGNVDELTCNDILIIPGGDTYRIAESLGENGLRALAKAIEDGMGYIGICAGAYLPLRSSITPLSSFNLADIKIANLSSKIPSGIEDIERYTVPYGCSLIFHPARGPINFSGDTDLKAPLYGGPLLIPSGRARPLLFFDEPKEETEILIDRDDCRALFDGRAGCVECYHGRGRLLLIAPHLEHPDFPEANAFLAEQIRGFESYNQVNRDHAPISESYNEKGIKEIQRIVVDLRMLSNAVQSQTWKVGIKYWESEKLLFFIDAVRKRINRMAREFQVNNCRFPEDILVAFSRARDSLRLIQDDGDDSALLGELVDDLSRGTSLFMNSYFEFLASESISKR